LQALALDLHLDLAAELVVLQRRSGFLLLALLAGEVSGERFVGGGGRFLVAEVFVSHVLPLGRFLVALREGDGGVRERREQYREEESSHGGPGRLRESHQTRLLYWQVGRTPMKFPFEERRESCAQPFGSVNTGLMPARSLSEVPDLLRDFEDLSEGGRGLRVEGPVHELIVDGEAEGLVGGSGEAAGASVGSE